MTSAGHICAECPDSTRVDRGCPYPLHDERARRRDVEPSCRVLAVPTWFFDSAELGAVIELGGVSPADVDARTWELARHAREAIAHGQRATEWQQRRRKEIIASALERARGGAA